MMLTRKTGGKIARPRGQVYLSAGGSQAFPGTTAWIAVPGTFAPDDLKNFTHSAGVLTYTGPGEVVLITLALSVSIAVTSGDVSFGVSVDDGDPAAGKFIDGLGIYAGQYRGVPFVCSINLASGENLRMKARDNNGGSAALLTDIGSGLIIHAP
jgi:hypothetical protein